MTGNPALVVGLSIHGLAIARALAKQGVEVHCLTERVDDPPPTSHTRFARVHRRDGLNHGPLVQHLLSVADDIGSVEKIVLFPTSDRIVQSIGLGWEELHSQYLLSWSGCRELVLKLLKKENLQQVCESAEINHPGTLVVNGEGDLDAVKFGGGTSLVAKPSMPLSSFKAIKLQARESLLDLVVRYSADLPFVVQEWIEEGELVSCSGFLANGEAIFLACSKKIDASPPGLGQGTVFELVEDPEIRDLTVEFAARCGLTGPIAIEFKRDAQGKCWLIEPNVGRSEYCVDLLIQNGFNLPYIEYQSTVASKIESRSSTLPERRYIWFDTDKDPTCFIRNLSALSSKHGRFGAPIFPFFGHDDWRPYFSALSHFAVRIFRAVLRRLLTLIRPGTK